MRHADHLGPAGRYRGAAGVGVAAAAAVLLGGAQPPAVTPGAGSAPPSDAIVLFDGSPRGDRADPLGEWRGRDGSPAAWAVAGGEMTVSGGDLVSRRLFGDCQVHVEFATPAASDGQPQGLGQGRGNSGVYIQGRYEVQVLDSYQNETYPLGQCGAIYGQHAPLVNASREPGAWQSYDIIFRAARFDVAGARVAPATLTVLHNGVLVHDHASLSDPTGGPLLNESPDEGPILLQDHGNPVRYRNIWVRPLAGR